MVASLTLAAAAAANITRTITFDNLHVGTSQAETIGAAYEPQGLVFSTPVAKGFSSEALAGAGGSGDCGDPTARSGLTESLPNYAEGFCTVGEGFAAGAEIFAVLTNAGHAVSFDIGNPNLEAGQSESWIVQTFNASRGLVAEKHFTVTTPGVLTPESIEAAGFQITYVRIAMVTTDCEVCTQAFHSSGIDNFSFETEGTIANPTLELARLEPASVEQRRTRAENIELFRLGGSDGEVRLSVAGLPSGVTPEFSNERLQGLETFSQLTLNAGLGVVPGTYAVEITATPEVAAAGSVAVHGVFMLTVSQYQNSFTLGLTPPESGGTIALRPCQSKSVDYAVSANPYFTGPVTVTAPSSAPPADMSLRQQEQGPDADLYGVGPSGAVTVSRSEAPGSGPFTFHIEARNPAGEAEVGPTMAVVRAAPTIEHGVSFSAGVETFEGFPGDKGYLYIRGEGFCPNARVWLGNQLAQARVVSSSYNELGVEVPRSATPGQVRVESGGEIAEAPLFVNTLRDTSGFSFTNHTYGARIHQAEVEEVYGNEETHECLFEVTCWYKPSAWALEQFTNNSLGGEPGLCFGEAYATAIELAYYEDVGAGLYPPPLWVAPGRYPPPGANDNWELEGTSGPSEALKRRLVGLFSIQFSDQLIPIALNRVLEVHNNPHQDENEIEAALSPAMPTQKAPFPARSSASRSGTASMWKGTLCMPTTGNDCPTGRWPLTWSTRTRPTRRASRATPPGASRNTKLPSKNPRCTSRTATGKESWSERRHGKGQSPT
jgi:hypothetical protein